MSEEELIHYGVKGMKWGVRKSDGSYGVGSNSDIRTNREAKRFAKEQGLRKSTSGERREIRKQMAKERFNLATEMATKHPDSVLVSARFQGETAPTLRTGREFTASVISGRAVDINSLSVASLSDDVTTKYGEAVLNTYINPRYIEDRSR